MIDESDHGLNIVQEAEAERFEFERDLNSLFRGVITEVTTTLNCPIPLGLGWNDLALPEIFPQHQQNIMGFPGSGEINEFFAASQVKLADRFIEIDQAERD